MCTVQLMSHDKGPLVDQDMPWLFVTEIKTNVAAIWWSDRANRPTKKDEKHLGAVWSNILISPSCLFADGKAREGHRPLFTLRYLTAQTLLKSKRFEAPTYQPTHDTSAAFFWICLKMDSEMWKARWRQAKYNSHICTSFWEWLCYDKCCSDHQPNAISSLARELTVN